MGRIALLSNRLADAEKWFQKALALQPGDTDTKVMLAEAFYRGDDFEKAGDTLDGMEESNVPGLYDGPFPWEETFGFHLAGMVGHDFFKRYSVTFDFEKMRIVSSGP